ncbi:MAG: methyltransferase domain-containing protein [Verrucomicrobiia bacterium]|jgi:ubiquinone/menaquinone biosynthesis C-methylase UbiE
MDEEYLATGFRDVDGAQNQDAYFECLTLLDSLPYYREYKTRSYALLELHPGQTVLEAGCGLGDDAFRMAERVMPGGKVVGVDASAAMISKAWSRDLAARLPVGFLVGDIKALPFANHSFARCRVDRVLQHIREPQRAIVELVRILEPGGLLLAYDNDWGTFAIASEAIQTTRAIERFWRSSFTNSGIGRDLPDYFRAAGLADVIIRPGTSVITDFETADKVYNLRATVQKAAEENLISASQGCVWIDEQIERTTKGSFSASLTAYTVVGKKRRGGAQTSGNCSSPSAVTRPRNAG